MGDGELLTLRWKTGALLRSDAKFMRKGGENMSEIREALTKTMMGVLDGKIPLDTAEQVHLTAHRHVMDRYADEKEARRIGDEKLAANLNESLRRLKLL